MYYSVTTLYHTVHFTGESPVIGFPVSVTNSNHVFKYTDSKRLFLKFTLLATSPNSNGKVAMVDPQVYFTLIAVSPR